MFDFNPKTGEGSGHWRSERGADIPFLPEEPATAPPYELVSTTETDPKSPDGHTHYLIGGDPTVVELIIAFYENRGKTVPDGYAEEAASHAAAVEAAKK